MTDLFISFADVCRVHLKLEMHHGLSRHPELYKGLRFRGRGRAEIHDEDVPVFIRRYQEFIQHKRNKAQARKQIQANDKRFFMECMKAARTEIWDRRELSQRDRKHAIRLRAIEMYHNLKTDLQTEKACSVDN